MFVECWAGDGRLVGEGAVQRCVRTWPHRYSSRKSRGRHRVQFMMPKSQDHKYFVQFRASKGSFNIVWQPEPERLLKIGYGFEIGTLIAFNNVEVAWCIVVFLTFLVFVGAPYIRVTQMNKERFVWSNPDE